MGEKERSGDERVAGLKRLCTSATGRTNRGTETELILPFSERLYLHVILPLPYVFCTYNSVRAKNCAVA